MPSTRTRPSVASNNRGTSESNVVLPAPVLPMIAVVFPGDAVKLMSRSTGSAAPGYWKPACSKTSSPRPTKFLIGVTGGRTEDSVPSTSVIRSAQTVARGTMIITKVAIMTENRIWIR